MSTINFSPVVHLVLPLMNASARAFRRYLIEGYLLTDRKRVVAVVDYERSLLRPDHVHMFGLPNRTNDLGGYTQTFALRAYEDRYYIDGKLYIVYDYSRHDITTEIVHNIYDGKYSKIPERTFHNIRERCILLYKYVNEDGSVSSSDLLLACSPYKKDRDLLRRKLETSLGVSIPETAELYDKIKDEFFADSVKDIVKIYSPDFEDDIQKYSPRTTHAEFMRGR